MLFINIKLSDTLIERKIFVFNPNFSFLEDYEKVYYFSLE